MIIAHGATLDVALTLAQAGTVTSVTLRIKCRITKSTAATQLADYALRGYLTRTADGSRGNPAAYAITPAGTERLHELKRIAATRQRYTATQSLNLGAMLFGLCSGFATGATGCR